MDFINCCNTFTDSLIINTIQFWSENSYEHIDVLLNGFGEAGAVLQSCFRDTLTDLFLEFETIYNTSKCTSKSKDIKSLLKQFLSQNQKFLGILQRLKFEGFNGYPILYESVYHFIYEQQYVADLFRPLGFIVNKRACSVIVNTCYKTNSYMQTNLECIYNNIYFWSLIGAEHTSIIATVSPLENQLPETTKSLLTNFANRFNSINYQLSTIYCRLNKNNLSNTFDEFVNINNDFLLTLLNFSDPDSAFIPVCLRSKLPDLFYSILNHLIAEHSYIKTISGDFQRFFE
ncbi:MAG: hypothetical protein Q4F05_14420 [bacterium]|nr:hypothetical protein [bacterium]